MTGCDWTHGFGQINVTDTPNNNSMREPLKKLTKIQSHDMDLKVMNMHILSYLSRHDVLTGMRVQRTDLASLERWGKPVKGLENKHKSLTK